MQSISHSNNFSESLQYSFGTNIPLEALFGFERDIHFYQKRKKEKVRQVFPPVFPVGTKIADTHAHLEMLKSPSLALARSAYYGVRFICCMVDVHEDAETTFNMLPSWIEDTKHVYQQYNLGSFEQDCPTLRVAIGCHPHNAKNYTVALENKLEEALHNPLVCAIGEVGLDYHYNLSPVKDQQEAFRKQIRLAHKTGLPLILHMREAHEDGFNILCEEGFPEAGVLLHCFNLSPEVLEPWAEKGCYIAFGGPLTFKSMPEVACSAKVVSSDKLLTETDSPYMTPEPLRGIECGPDYTIFTAAKLLEVRNCTTEDSAKMLLDQLFNNACSLLNREPTQWQRG